jgi:hypothetical protein
VRDALRLRRQLKLEDAAKLKALRNAVRTGIADPDFAQIIAWTAGISGPIRPAVTGV